MNQPKLLHLHIVGFRMHFKLMLYIFLQVQRCISLGGGDLKLVISRIMMSSFTDDLMATFNWSGKCPAHIVGAPRHSFSVLHVCRAIIGKHLKNGISFFAIYQVLYLYHLFHGVHSLINISTVVFIGEIHAGNFKSLWNSIINLSTKVFKSAV